MPALCISTYLYFEADSSQIIRFDKNFTCNFRNRTSKLTVAGHWDTHSLNLPFYQPEFCLCHVYCPCNTSWKTNCKEWEYLLQNSTTFHIPQQISLHYSFLALHFLSQILLNLCHIRSHFFAFEFSAL